MAALEVGPMRRLRAVLVHPISARLGGEAVVGADGGEPGMIVSFELGEEMFEGVSLNGVTISSGVVDEIGSIGSVEGESDGIDSGDEGDAGVEALEGEVSLPAEGEVGPDSGDSGTGTKDL